MVWPAVDGGDILVLVARLAMIGALYGFLLTVAVLITRDIRGRARGGALSPPAIALEMMDPGQSGAAAGTRWRFSDSLTIGRGSGNSLVIDDPFLSAEHAGIVREAGQWWLYDRKSTNGVLLNGGPVTSRAVLKSGDVVQFGNVCLRVSDLNG